MNFNDTLMHQCHVNGTINREPKYIPHIVFVVSSYSGYIHDVSQWGVNNYSTYTMYHVYCIHLLFTNAYNYLKSMPYNLGTKS